MKNNIVLVLIFTSTLVCKSQTNLKDYYYQFSDKTETKVYKYVDKKDSENIEYWKIILNPKTKVINTISYDSSFNIYNTFDEVITENGAELIRYTDFEENIFGNKTEVKAEIVEKDVFKWNGEKQYSYSVKYRNKYGRFEFKKKRVALGFEKKSVRGKQYETIKFKGIYSIYAIDQDDKYGFYQYSFYAKGIGMIKYERKIPVKEELIELELVDILTEKEFKKIKARR